MIMHRNIADWHGKPLVDRDGDKIGKLEDVYVDVETDQPMFGTIKEGMIGRHLTFVPLGGITIGPDNVQLAISKEQVQDAPNIELEHDELSQADESTLYHHYQLNYTPPATESGRRLVRRRHAQSSRRRPRRCQLPRLRDQPALAPVEIRWR